MQTSLQTAVKTKGLSGAEALLRTLRGMGVEVIFASPGSDWAPLWEALAKPHAEADYPRYLSVRHEGTAIAMASGYAKSTGKLPAVVIHTTVGVLHATMGIRAALHERVPIVILAGESVSFGEAPAVEVGRQWLRLLADNGGPARLAESVVKWSYALNAPHLLPASVARACQLAMEAPRGPVFLGLSSENLMLTMEADPPVASALPQAPVANAAGLATLADMLAAARAPLFITEEIGKNQAAVARLVEVAELVGAPVVEAWHPDYVNFPRSHPLYGGVAVTEMPELVRAADLVVLVDAVAPWHPPSSLPAAGTKVAVLGESPLHPHLAVWNFQADLMLTGDADGSLAQLATLLRARIAPGSRAASIERHRSDGAARRAKVRAAAHATGDRAVIETAWVAHEFSAIFPKDAIFVNETITHRLDFHRLLDSLEPGMFYESSYGGLGMGLGTALGVKSASPNRPVILAIGD
ncbi:MAG: thiamine pyrophosphate-binding protein, partial [Burkholderiales bacterium]